jgi:hypothetical protein
VHQLLKLKQQLACSFGNARLSCAAWELDCPAAVLLRLIGCQPPDDVWGVHNLIISVYLCL